MSVIDTLLEYLGNAQKPLILLGAGARKAAPQIIKKAEHFDIPIQTTWNAIDLIPWEHRLFVGRPGGIATRGANNVIQNCDLLLAIGARLDEGQVAYKYDKFAPNARKVMVDIDQGEAGKIPNLDLFIQADAVDFMRELNDQTCIMPPHSAWLETCQIWKQQYKLEGTTATYQLCEQLSDDLTADDVLVIAPSGMQCAIFCAGFRQKAGQRVILPSCGLGSMGAGIPSAIGVALASGRHVVCVEGDGSFMQNIQELEVVRRLNLPITFYVISNGGYASIRNSETRAFGRLAGADNTSGLTLPNIKDVAAAFGIKVIVINAPPDEVFAPRVMYDGRGNLGDMWPYEVKND